MDCVSTISQAGGTAQQPCPHPGLVDQIKDRAMSHEVPLTADSTSNSRPGVGKPSLSSLAHGIPGVKGLLWLTNITAKFWKFIGPGIIISVAYIDPDNFQTAITSGAHFKFKPLFMILLASLIATYLQTLCIKLGTVTGMDLAQMNRAHLPSWLNVSLWMIAEAAIICVDTGQVISTAIALNILFPKIPLIAGCVLSAADTFLLLLFYRPDGSLRGTRGFEIFVSMFVLAIFISASIQLSHVAAPADEVLRGFLPSRAIFVSQGLYQSCAILGGTIMPHTLYLGSNLVQPRLRDFDRRIGKYREVQAPYSGFSGKYYRPSNTAIKSCLTFSIIELCVSLFVVSVFVNSTILIISAAFFSSDVDDADLFGLYDIFVQSISQASGTTFALGLLFSGTSAGIVATMAGQIVCEGAMNWRLSPFLRRLLTRALSIVPGVIIAAIVGRPGLAAALNGCDVVRSTSLMFLVFPLVWYTSMRKYMQVEIDDGDEQEVGQGVTDQGTDRLAEESGGGTRTESYLNWRIIIFVSWVIWLAIACINVANLVFLGYGIAAD